MGYTSTPYDDVGHTLLYDCSHLILPVINEMFGENYDGTEQIVFQPNELYIQQQNGRQRKRITDSSFYVIKGNVTKKYHYEIQSTEDNTMSLRMFEYDAQIALSDGKITDNVLEVSFPHSALLYLRHSERTPDTTMVRIKTPGTTAEYGIPVLKVQKYSIDEIFDKKLFYLIPFYIFIHEARFKVYEEDENQLQLFLAEYRHICECLNKMLDNGEIDTYTKQSILDMGKKVVRNLAKDYKLIREGVETIMGGKILDYPAKRILNKGKVEGRDVTCIEHIRNLMTAMHLSVDEAMTALKIPEDKRAQYKAAVTAK
ncbi:hypothetical protein [Anaerovibrio sp. RM50]|uniref:hypothetical protein n=1 Tax=Anaerovibrio sp. RM50 TaxID=1200557 RepID=UPI0006860679|nr:hypothetical protein [Anaerovibrio sp. RM50]